ncbi:hypothetical protein CgunFtcFv8_025232 [Champsocephalus gunnari]|uniref:Helicase POLQ-like n=1 Tax=Champsocephalus gunnari TaxID=52237 RepID=A0AAN8H2N9_CHAGU|nr:hypothetical protein CgunFtcFv8_025232 [Champsocephalus gunnari]
MNSAEKRDIRIKRVSSRKRSRDSSQMTPERKRGSEKCPQICRLSSIMAEQQQQQQQPAAELFCSDSEDLFGDYDSLLQDSSLLDRLDDAEQSERQRDVQRDVQRDFTNLRTKTDEDVLTDSILDAMGEEDLPPSMQQFKDQVQETRVRLQGADQTSTPLRNTKTSTPLRTKEESRPPRGGGGGGGGGPPRRRGVADALKRTLLCNAASPATASRSAALKEAVLSEEMSVAMQALEEVSEEKTPDLGPFFGLPSRVKELMLRLKGIQSLYEWQETCLNLPSVQRRKNLIYSLPTSGGKTLVAEILMLRELLCRKKDALFILPYVSLVQEKVRGLASFGVELDFLVEEYAGSKGRFPPVKRKDRRSLYVATIEKAHSLVNSLIENQRIDELGLVVVDELHMLGDGSRGAIIEMTLAKVLYTAKSTQIIGMSATLGNIKDLQTFLRAENYSNDFRPVQLKEYVKLQDTIYEVDPKEEDCFKFSRLLNFKYSSSMQKLDPDHIIAMVTEVIPKHSCLVFCPTKKNCENVGGLICRYLRKDFLLLHEQQKLLLLSQLEECGRGSVCPVLRRTVPYGVAYHHSGLTGEERRLLEEAYTCGTLCLLTCTSTLAAGVNLPARRVILRSPYVAADFLKRSQYKQMVGRAGRAGIDSQGESILILQEKDRLTAKTLVSAPMEKCFSNLLLDEGKGLRSLILSLVGLNITWCVQQLQDFLRCTLLSVQEEHVCAQTSLQEALQLSLDFLQENQLIVREGDALSVTRLGKATYKGSVDLLYSSVLYRDLSKGLEGLMLNSFLHLLYLVTPYAMTRQVKPDWMLYYTQFTLLSAAEQKMSAAVGVPESFVARRAAGQTVRKSPNAEVVSRMYLALVLFSLLKDLNLWIVSDRFQMSRGFIQSLLSSSSAFCSCVLHFTEELEEFWPFRALLTELTRRLSYCVTSELIPLMEVAGVMEARAKQLYNAGYKTLTHLANADPAVLSDTLDNLLRKQANQIVASAKMLLREKAAALQEEVDELLTLPRDLPSAPPTAL